MRKIALIILTVLMGFSFLGYANSMDTSKYRIKKKTKYVTTLDNKTEFNFFAGRFDFSDAGAAANIFGLQHQNDKLFRNSWIGRLSPITGGFFSDKGDAYYYTGVQAEYNLGFVSITPSFAPGYYHHDKGKDLGYPIQFKSEVQMSLNLTDKTHLGMSYNHISNASLGAKNPGANSYMFNFLKKF